MKLHGKVFTKQIICILGGALLWGAMSLSARIMPSPIEKGYLSRNSYGGGELEYKIKVGGLEEEEISLQVAVGEQQYTDKGFEDAFQQVIKRLETSILKGNESLQQVRSDLDLITWDADSGLHISWESENPEILDSFGTVMNKELTEKGREVRLEASLSDGIHKKKYYMTAHIKPPLLTAQDKAKREFLYLAAAEDEAQRTEKGFYLPGEYEGRKLYYKDADASDYRILFLMGVILAFVFYAKDKSDQQVRVKKRKQQMLLDYSEIVSKLMIFLGAGMTVPNAWERIVQNYEADFPKRRKLPRFAYEEMCKTYYQIKSGVPEGTAYREFGLRCELQPYLKLCGLLEQNRRTGTKNMRMLMQLEMSEAFEQRKNLAKRLGEEAGTKLLAPLFLMLGIIMVMIIVPAFLAFT